MLIRYIREKGKEKEKVLPPTGGRKIPFTENTEGPFRRRR